MASNAIGSGPDHGSPVCTVVAPVRAGLGPDVAVASDAVRGVVGAVAGGAADACTLAAPRSSSTPPTAPVA